MRCEQMIKEMRKFYSDESKRKMKEFHEAEFPEKVEMLSHMCWQAKGTVAVLSDNFREHQHAYKDDPSRIREMERTYQALAVLEDSLAAAHLDGLRKKLNQKVSHDIELWWIENTIKNEYAHVERLKAEREKKPQ